MFSLGIIMLVWLVDSQFEWKIWESSLFYLVKFISICSLINHLKTIVWVVATHSICYKCVKHSSYTRIHYVKLVLVILSKSFGISSSIRILQMRALEFFLGRTLLWMAIATWTSQEEHRTWILWLSYISSLAWDRAKTSTIKGNTNID